MKRGTIEVRSTFDHIQELEFLLSPATQTRCEFQLDGDHVFQAHSIEALCDAERMQLSRCSLSVVTHRGVLHSTMLDHILTTDSLLHARVARLESILEHLLTTEIDPDRADATEKRVLGQRAALKKLGYTGGHYHDSRVFRTPMFLERATQTTVVIDCPADFFTSDLRCRVSLKGNMTRFSKTKVGQHQQ